MKDCAAWWVRDHIMREQVASLVHEVVMDQLTGSPRCGVRNIPVL